MSTSVSQQRASFHDYVGSVVVLDAARGFVILGTLVGADEHYVSLENADVHDLRDTQTTRDLYILKSRNHGIRANRRRVTLRRDEIIGMSLLRDVIE